MDLPLLGLNEDMPRPLAILDRIYITRLGVEFPHNGDTVIWLWPWQRDGKPKLISLGFTGTGEWGDARFNNLSELDAEWQRYFEAETKRQLTEHHF